MAHPQGSVGRGRARAAEGLASQHSSSGLGQADSRLKVRVLVHPRAKIEIQIVPAPTDAGPFQFLPAVGFPSTRRPLVLDPAVSDICAEVATENDHRLYKTVKRGIYDDAARRAGSPPSLTQSGST